MSTAVALLEKLVETSLIFFDDVWALAHKAAAASADDMVVVAKKTASATVNAVPLATDDASVGSSSINDAGIKQEREHAVVGKILAGSYLNKIPLTGFIMLLSRTAPVLLKVSLGLGGSYLAYEGAHKCVGYATNARNFIRRKRGLPPLAHGHDDEEETTMLPQAPVIENPSLLQRLGNFYLGKDPAERVVMKDLSILDIILSMEILLLTQKSLGEMGAAQQAMVMLAAGAMTTTIVYGVVYALVRMDNVVAGMNNPENRFYAPRLAKNLQRGLPAVMSALGYIGTGAMLGVGGEIFGHLIPEAIEALHMPVFAHAAHKVATFLPHTLGMMPVGGEWLGHAANGLVIGAGLVAAGPALAKSWRFMKTALTRRSKDLTAGQGQAEPTKPAPEVRGPQSAPHEKI